MEICYRVFVDVFGIVCRGAGGAPARSVFKSGPAAGATLSASTQFQLSMWLGRPFVMRYHDIQLNLPGELRDQGVGTSRVAPRFP